MEKYYRAYFEQLARKKIIGHTDAAPAYFFVKDVYDPVAFDNAVKACVKTPAFILEKYSYKLDDNNNRNKFKYPACRFNIVMKAQAGNQGSIDLAYQTCELIADKFIAKMEADLRDGKVIELADGSRSPHIYFEVKNVPVDPIGPINSNYYGVSVGFPLKVKFAPPTGGDDWEDPLP